MFEFWITGLKDDEGTFSHNGTSHDFLEVMCRIGELVGPTTAGKFLEDLFTEKRNQLDHLRMIDWNFRYQTPAGSIRLVKKPR